MEPYNETCSQHQIAVHFCQIQHFTAIHPIVPIIPHLGMNAKRRRMFVHDGSPRYGAYLLRYWEVRSEHPGQPSTWRFSLEEAGTGERRGFRDLPALVAYLEGELTCEGAGAASAREKE
jgi:hypothetical protein